MKTFSRGIATAILLLALLGLRGSLRNFHLRTPVEASPSKSVGIVSYLHSSRKLLHLSFSVVSNQILNSSGPNEIAEESKECAKVKHIKNSAACCEFVKSTDSCLMDDGFIQYVQIPYCSFPHARPLAFVLLALWLLFLFITVGMTADDYFCPSLAVISKTLGISQNVAGVTFLAYGNGAPDIFSALAALSDSKNGGGQLGIQALFGAGMFVTTVVVGVMSFLSHVTVASRPFTRDVLFYLGAVSWVFVTLYQQRITLGSSIGFIAFYVSYILVVILGHYIYQRWKRRLAATERYLASVASQSKKVIKSGDGMQESFQSDSTDAESPIISYDPTSGERTPLLSGPIKISEWRKFLMALKPIDTEEWGQSSRFWKCFLICKMPSRFFLNITVPVVDYDKEDHNWNKWLAVLQCFTMPVFITIATKESNKLVGEHCPVWAIALCVGVVFAFIVAVVTKSDRQPKAHFLFAYMAFAVAVIWIYITANEIVNLLQMFGIVFGLSDAILGLTFLAWGNSIGDLVSNSAMARQGFSAMAVSACFGGPLLNMLLGIGISCTILNATSGQPIPLHHRYHQYQISAGFLALSLSSSGIVVPLLGFKVPRMYGAYLILLYTSYLVTSVVAEIKHI